MWLSTTFYNLGLLYRKDRSSDCIGYCDADWAGDMDDRKSTSGYTCMFLRSVVQQGGFVPFFDSPDQVVSDNGP